MSYHTLQQPLPSHSSSPSSDSAVQVAVRIRPLNSRETSTSNSTPICRVHPSSPATVIIDPPTSRPTRRSLYPDTPSTTDERQFTFDFVYDDNSPSSPSPHYQQRVYQDLGQLIVNNALQGYNCSLLAYGQTSSGKSYSMMGTPDEQGQGLIPRICSALFHHISSSPSTTPSGDSIIRKLECSYIEIYSEKIRDLLDPRKKNLKIRENPKSGPYVEGSTSCAVADLAELLALMGSGNAERTIASTNLNVESSRSHAVFTLQLTTTTMDEASQLSSDVVSKIQLVDLAGSERVEQSGATGVRLKEANHINKSLTTLGRVVQALATRSEINNKSAPYGTMTSRKSVTRKGDDTFIPFRDSVLTWLLKESLGGNSKTIMLATLSPSDLNFDETLSTLRYASRAKTIVNQAKVNEDPNAELIRSLKAEVDALRARLAQAEAPSSLPRAINYSPSDETVGVVYETLKEKDAEMLKMNAHIAQLQSELAQNSVSLVEMEQQWQNKLRQAKELEESRMKEMQERGVSVVEVKDLPFLVNLNEDPAMTESLIYHLHEGKTMVGSRKRRDRRTNETDDSDEEEEKRIVLSGIHVKDAHCVITKHANGVVISPIGGVQAETHVNGEMLVEERALVHGDRVVIGQQHFFRFSRSKLTIEQEREREEERRKKKKEERKARISIITSPTSPTSALSPPSSSPISPHPPPFDFEFAQRELIVGGQNVNLRVNVTLNRSLNRSHIEDREPDSSPELPHSARLASQSLPLASVGEGGGQFQLMGMGKEPRSGGLEVSPRSGGSVMSPVSGGSIGPESPSPSCVKVVEEKEESERESEAVLQAPTFHLGRDVKGSVDWSSRRALTRGEIDEWVKQDRRFLAKHQQRLIDRSHLACQSLMQPLTQFSPSEYKAVSHSIYRWRWHVIKRALTEQILRLVFLTDEANAIASALGRPERYKVELTSSHCVLPEIFLSMVPFTTQFSQPQSSPLQRLRQMKVIFCQVVEVRRRMLPIPVLSFDLTTFQEQLAVLREMYHDMLDGAEDSRLTTALSSPTSSSISVSSLTPTPYQPLPSSDLYAHPQLLGRALCYLHALRYGHSIKHTATVLDERGEVAGLVGIEMEIASVDEDVARREIEKDEKQRAKEEKHEDAHHQHMLTLPSNPNDDELDSPSSSSSSSHEEHKTDSFLQSHRVLAIVVKLTHYDAGVRNLRRHGLQSVWVKYHVKDSGVAYRSRKVAMVDEQSRFMLEYEKTHYFSGMDLQMLMDWLEYDAIVFELFCRVEDGNKSYIDTKRGQRVSVTAGGGGGEDEGSEVDHGRRESLAKRVQSSSLNRSASKEKREPVEKSLASRTSITTPHHHHQRRSTIGGSLALTATVKEEVGVEIENGNKVVDHLLFACVDIEEEVVGKKGQYQPCSLKQEEDGKLIYRVTMNREKRVVISLLQADHRPFVLESLRSVTVTSLVLKTYSLRPSPPLHSPLHFPILEQFANVDHKLLICTTGWCRALDDHPFFSQASVAGERVQCSFVLECYFSETTVPVQVPVVLELKVYQKGGDKGGAPGALSMFTRQKSQLALNEGERFARIGCHVSVTRQSSPQTVGNVLREHELILEQQQRRIRFEHQQQHQRLLTKLQHTTPTAVQEVVDKMERGADGLTRHFTLRFSRILADLVQRCGIRVVVEVVGWDGGIKCGYLNERRKGVGEWEPKWTVLRPPYLFLYGKRGDKKEQNIVKLTKAEYSRGGGAGGGAGGGGGGGGVGSSTTDPFSFQIRNTSGQVVTLQAANASEMRSWMKALGANLAQMGLYD